MKRVPTASALAGARPWLIAGYALLVGLVIRGGIDRPPYDDSYFFKRFALNFLDHGMFAWNVADGPVYGNTSQLFQLLVTAVTALTRTHTVFALRLALGVTLVLGFAFSLRAAARHGAVLAATLGFCSPVMLLCALSGMETALAFALLAALCAVVDPERELHAHWLVAPLLVFAIWLTRPDATLLAGPIVLGLRWWRTRELPLRELLVSAGLIAIALLACRIYYGTALPLPFYAKQRALSPYDAHFVSLSAQSIRMRFSVFAWAALPLACLALTRLDVVNLTLLAVVGCFELYHLLGVIDVMGMHGRFYAPALPILIFAASRAERQRNNLGVVGMYAISVTLLASMHWWPIGPLANDENLTRAYYILGTVAAAVGLAAAGKRFANLSATSVVALALLASAVSFHPKLRTPPDDTGYLLLHESRNTVYRGLETLRACFGDSIHVYHSEVGVVGLRFEHGRVTDLAGLMSPDWLFQRTTFDAACLSEHPEAIFLPHRNYAGLNREIQDSRCLRNYTRVIAESSSPLHVRNDLLSRYQRCAMR